MIEIKNILIIFLIIFHISILKVKSAFKESNNWGARPSGMAGAFISISDDATGIAYNPAGISQITKKEIMYMYSKPYVGLEEVNLRYGFLSLICPFKKIGVFGLAWKNFNVSDLYQENSVIFSYGYKINKYLPEKIKQEILTGINLKYLFHSYELDIRTKNDPVFLNGSSKGNISIDIGVVISKITHKLPDLKLGIVVKNINQPNLGLSSNDPVYREFGIGISCHLERFLWMRYTTETVKSGKFKYDKDKVNRFIESFILSSDIIYRNKEINFKFGLELSLWGKLLNIRTGVSLQEFCLGLGMRLPLKIYKIYFDYGFSFPFYLHGTNGTHKISFSVRF